jgi:hypothetical protein
MLCYALPCVAPYVPRASFALPCPETAHPACQHRRYQCGLCSRRSLVGHAAEQRQRLRLPVTEARSLAPR